MEPNTKTFTTRVLLSTATGLALPEVPFTSIHEAIEHLLGEPVWTHQLGSPEPWSRARDALVAQHPAFAAVQDSALTLLLKDADGDACQIICEEWIKCESKLLGADSFTITRGNGRSPEVAQHDAMVSLHELATAQGKPLIVLSVE